MKSFIILNLKNLHGLWRKERLLRYQGTVEQTNRNNHIIAETFQVWDDHFAIDLFIINNMVIDGILNWNLHFILFSIREVIIIYSRILERVTIQLRWLVCCFISLNYVTVQIHLPIKKTTHTQRLHGIFLLLQKRIHMRHFVNKSYTMKTFLTLQ